MIDSDLNLLKMPEINMADMHIYSSFRQGKMIAKLDGAPAEKVFRAPALESLRTSCKGTAIPLDFPVPFDAYLRTAQPAFRDIVPCAAPGTDNPATRRIAMSVLSGFA